MVDSKRPGTHDATGPQDYAPVGDRTNPDTLNVPDNSYAKDRNKQLEKHISINGRNYWRASEISDWLDEQAGASSKAEGRS